MIELAVDDSVAWLRDAMNSLNRALTGALEEAVARVAAFVDVS